MWWLAILQAVSVVEVLNNQSSWGNACLCFPDFFYFQGFIALSFYVSVTISVGLFVDPGKMGTAPVPLNLSPLLHLVLSWKCRVRRGEGKKICQRNFSFSVVFHFQVFTFVAVRSCAEVLAMQKVEVVKNILESGGDHSACLQLPSQCPWTAGLRRRLKGLSADSSPPLTPKGSQTQLGVGRDLLGGNNADGKHQTGWYIHFAATVSVYPAVQWSEEPLLPGALVTRSLPCHGGAFRCHHSVADTVI